MLCSGKGNSKMVVLIFFLREVILIRGTIWRDDYNDELEEIDEPFATRSCMHHTQAMIIEEYNGCSFHFFMFFSFFLGTVWFHPTSTLTKV
jgi:hypothetical protein